MKLSLASLAIGVLALLLLALAGPAYRLGVPLPTAFALLRWGAYVGLAAVVLGAATAAVFRRQRRVAILGGLAALLGLTAAVIPYSWQRTAQSVPRIHDITTDIDNPPSFDAVLARRADAPNPIERSDVIDKQQREGYPDLAPITVSLPPAQAFDRALAVAQASGWEIVTSDKSTGRIEATDTTRWFGFKDDVVVRLTPWGAGTRVDVRSVSRVGLSDVGTNAARIREFLEELQE